MNEFLIPLIALLHLIWVSLYRYKPLGQRLRWLKTFQRTPLEYLLSQFQYSSDFPAPRGRGNCSNNLCKYEISFIHSVALLDLSFIWRYKVFACMYGMFFACVCLCKYVSDKISACNCRTNKISLHNCNQLTVIKQLLNYSTIQNMEQLFKIWRWRVGFSSSLESCVFRMFSDLWYRISFHWSCVIN